jgi:hypothetical protein
LQWIIATFPPEAVVIDTVKIPTVGLGSARSPKHRSGSKAASSSGKRRSALSSLSPTELLAKIDALDWDETVSADTTVLADDSEKRTQYPDHSTSNWRVAAIVATLVAVLAVLYVVLTPDTGSPAAAVAQTQAIQPAPAPAPIEVPKVEEPPPLAVPEPVPNVAEPAAIDDSPAVTSAPTAEDVAKKAQRKAERQRKAREAEIARQEQLERERRQQEEIKQRADREAAEAARAAKAREQVVAPKAPGSPQDLCAAEGNFFARGLCEARICGKAEWRNHPFCVKRMDDQLRAINRGSN